MTLKQILLLALAAGLFFWSEPVTGQCSMCRAVVESNDANTGEGLNNGILYLMGFPYIIMISLGILIFRKVYKDNRKFRGETVT